MGWNSIFRNKVEYFASERPNGELSKVITILKKERAKRVLDLGCGAGRNTIVLAKHFDTYAMDNSSEGIKVAKGRLKERKMKARFRKASCFVQLPYSNRFFDAVLSFQVIYHGYHRQVKFCISEIRRILRPGGIIFITLALPKEGYKRADRAKYRKIAKNTFVPESGAEKDIVHYLYPSKAAVRADFRRFKIIRIYVDKGKHLCVLARK